MQSCIEEAVVVPRIVKDADIPVFRWLPPDERQQATRIILQHEAVIVDALEDRRRNWKNHTCRIVAALRKHVMDEIAMEATISVLKRVDVDESKREDGCCHHRIKAQRSAAVEGNHAFNH